MPFFPAVLAGFVVITCARCGHVQLRARRPTTAELRCSRCSAVLPDAQARAKAKVRSKRAW